MCSIRATSGAPAGIVQQGSPALASCVAHGTEQNRSRVRLCMAAEARSSNSIRGRGGGGVGGLLGGLLVVAAAVWVVWVVMAWGPFETRTWRASWLGEY